MTPQHKPNHYDCQDPTNLAYYGVTPCLVCSGLESGPDYCAGRGYLYKGRADSEAVESAFTKLYAARMLIEPIALPSVRVVGCESSGKTEIVSFIAETFGVPRLPGECSRMAKAELEGDWNFIRARGFRVDQYQRAVFDKQLQMEASAPTPSVGDRCILDPISYSSEFASVAYELWSRPELSGLIEKLQKMIVFFVRPQEGLNVNDGVRAPSTFVEKQRIDAKLEVMLQFHKVKYWSIDVLNASRRESEISMVLEAKGFQRCLKS